MFRREQPKTKAPTMAPASALETTVGPNTYFRGEIQSDGGVRIQGIFEGNVDITGNLIITEGAKVIAEVSANNISISGAVKGNINGNRVEILETGRVWGDLTINSLLLNEGAYLRGQTTMHGDIEPPLIEAPRRSKQAAEQQQQQQQPAATIVDVKPNL
ncbi:MAG: polymer-forming cytoskeletal protein [Chloroflexi bacterium]|nr:polymer-forming cytoskeletal protein [Chloroflexota bacterium]